jgi:hypothetical protein
VLVEEVVHLHEIQSVHHGKMARVERFCLSGEKHYQTGKPFSESHSENPLPDM